jgi:hypothetical protein
VEHLQRRALKKRPDYVSQNIDKVRGFDLTGCCEARAWNGPLLLLLLLRSIGKTLISFQGAHGVHAQPPWAHSRVG